MCHCHTWKTFEAVQKKVNFNLRKEQNVTVPSEKLSIIYAEFTQAREETRPIYV